VKRLFNIMFSSRQRIKITIGIATIVAFSGITLYITLSGLGIHWPTEERISGKKFELKKQRRELRLALERATLLSNKEHALKQVIKNFWEVKPDTHIDSNMRAKIETCAKNAGFELQSMGNIRKSKLAKGFNKLEITVSANSPMDKVVHFLNNIRQAKPDFFWQQCSIRPDNITNPDKVYLNGTLAIVSVDQAEVEKLLKQEAK
jgi:Type II secretion system (T2SS), protein M subtype b